jgi:iturin family lipopeptide synthetase B
MMDDTNSIEAVLTSVWKAVLQIDGVGTREHFLDLGGNSITAIQIISSIHEVYGVELSMNEFFKCLTIAELSDELKRKGVPAGEHLRAGD